ncbi:hypothetical protein SD70_11425 [Gordoniibacillus kamchatkensis]|uniref:STAS domain-containing protein n=1 Tax=Gordoniibacillus kamchatkensis TaxID=1590651 RepID=A0ABR5AIF1_9BACL|nr:STAS domain-containing protein [Paenibacillus sp. VKM B-2647]KIL40829.1 hypothetical protein SD70_11425 [Paenibacillus sp. VKM B-2647]
MESQFRAEVRDAGNAIVIDMFGDLSKEAQDPMFCLRSWEEPPQPGKGYLIYNFTNVPYINSLGIALLIRLVRSTAKAGYQTFAYGLTPHYQKLFLMVGLTEYMMIYPDEYAIRQRIESLASS